MWRRIRGEHDPDVGGRRGIDPEVVPDHAGDERRHIRSLAGELYDGAHHDLGLVGGREPDEPAVVRSVGILRRAGLAGDGDAAAEAPGAARRAPLHHTDHRLPQPRELVGQEPEARVRGGGGANEIRRSGAPIAREHLVEPHHVDERLRVLPLPDGEVERDGRRPAARAVHAVVVIRAAGEHGRDLAREVDPRARAEPQPARVLEQRREPDLQAQLIEVHIAALRDRVGECQVAVTAGGPAPEETIAVLQPAAARDRHVRAQGDDPAAQRHGRDGQLPGGAGGIKRLDRAIEQRVRRARVEGTPVVGIDAAHEGVRVVARCAVQRENLPAVGIEREHGAALARREDPRHVALQVQVDGGGERAPRDRREGRGGTGLAHHASQRTDLHEPHAIRSAQRVVVLALQPILAEQPTESHGREAPLRPLRLGHLPDVAHQMGHQGAVRVMALRLGLNEQARKYQTPLLQRRHDRERRIGEDGDRQVGRAPVAGQHALDADAVELHDGRDAPQRRVQ